MSEMYLDHISESTQVTLQAGQRLVVKVLNPDGSVAQAAFDDAVPAGDVFTGVVTYTGHLISTT